MSNKRIKGDSLGDRMKKYEHSYKVILPENLPVVIRIDGRTFHNYTADMKRPFDQHLAQAFWAVCQYLCNNIPGCKLAYHQSDEISLVITNDDKITTQPWFDNNLQKLVSVTASMATAVFNDQMRKVNPYLPIATFDSRAWILPPSEVVNYFIWRQQDATRNSISMVAHHYFEHNDIQHLSSSELQDRLMEDKGINWNEFEVWKKRGVCIVKEEFNRNEAKRYRWAVDFGTPIFTKIPEYITSRVTTQSTT